MLQQLVVFFSSLLFTAQHLHQTNGFAGKSLSPHRTSETPFLVTFPNTVLRESSLDSPEASASEKAAKLKLKAEEAKRKADELKKIAEAKAAAAMYAVKKANEQKDTVLDAGDNEGNEKRKDQKKETENAVKEIIVEEREKILVKADAIKEARNKAASRVIPAEAAIIPINEATIEFTAGILGGFLALALGAGPLLAAASAAAANYVSRKDDLGELNELVQSVSKASLGSYNWIAKLNAKYTLLGKISDSLDATIARLKKSEGESSEAIEKMENAVSQTTKQLQKLATDTDLLEGSKQALGAVGDILESGIDKAADANREYKLTERVAGAAKNAARNAIDRAKAKE